jgi:hypothetical protein
MDSAYLQLKLSVQKKAKNRANVEIDAERKKVDRELTQTTATTKVHKLTKPSLSFAISIFFFGFHKKIALSKICVQNSKPEFFREKGGPF